MATYKYTLAEPPSDPRSLELWLQHAAGFILFQDMREYAIRHLDSGLATEAEAAARQAIDDTVGGLMQILDGVTGRLKNDSKCISLRVKVELTDLESGELLSEVDLAHGDGMCMGYHGWLAGDFGKNSLVTDD